MHGLLQKQSRTWRGVAPLLLALCCLCLAERPAAPARSLARARSRLIREWKVVRADGLDLRSKLKRGAINNEGGVRLAPLPGNLLEWHFSFTGPENSTYQHGVYHGRILLPEHYPRKAPRIQLLTPNGRFHVKTDICLSASAYHQEMWDPAWNLQTIVAALRAYMTTAVQEVGGLQAPVHVRQVLAVASRQFHCPHCGTSHAALLGEDELDAGEKPHRLDLAPTSARHNLRPRFVRRHAILLLLVTLFMLFYHLVIT